MLFLQSCDGTNGSACSGTLRKQESDEFVTMPSIAESDFDPMPAISESPSASAEGSDGATASDGPSPSPSARYRRSYSAPIRFGDLPHLLGPRHRLPPSASAAGGKAACIPEDCAAGLPCVEDESAKVVATSSTASSMAFVAKPTAATSGSEDAASAYDLEATTDSFQLPETYPRSCRKLAAAGLLVVVAPPASILIFLLPQRLNDEYMGTMQGSVEEKQIAYLAAAVSAPLLVVLGAISPMYGAMVLETHEPRVGFVQASWRSIRKLKIFINQAMLFTIGFYFNLYTEFRVLHEYWSAGETEFAKTKMLLLQLCSSR
eukprot:TRINITY_DN15464_c0_g2_i3.p1 TRINITY_DN15464_c0_g2~~TRINITY_DN15464_c0_g2_i3.p1  ORF type:complete len:318 (+),score=26.86 TRINITY_DN15464_c0_g2_i3:78-1031(+)